ncbi:MAG: AraC family transcriptional regulator [Alistipes sp.]|nr:AraC family transcriptional regulator [Alistipes sp.]
MYGVNSPENKFFYLVPDDFNRMLDMHVSTVGCQRISSHESYPPERHPEEYLFDPALGRRLNEYQLIYIVSGEGDYKDERSEIEVREGQLIVLRPGRWHTYRPRSRTGWTEYYIGIRGRVPARLIKRIFGDRTVVQPGVNDELVQLFRSALTAADPECTMTRSLLCGIAFHILGLLDNILTRKDSGDDRIMTIVNKIKVLLAENIAHDVDIRELAHRVNISYSWLRKIFRDCTGYPIARYMRMLRLQRAQHLLTNTSLPVKEISFMTGFASPEYFHNTFRRATGLTPADYRLGGKQSGSER